MADRILILAPLREYCIASLGGPIFASIFSDRRWAQGLIPANPVLEPAESYVFWCPRTGPQRGSRATNVLIKLRACQEFDTMTFTRHHHLPFTPYVTFENPVLIFPRRKIEVQTTL